MYKEFVAVPPPVIGTDFLHFRKILQQYYHPHFQNAMLVGPDTGSTGGPEWPVRDFLNVAGSVVNAVTFHQYYGGGELSFLSNYTDPKLLDGYKGTVASFVAHVKSSNYPNITMWNGETSSTYSAPGKNLIFWVGTSCCVGGLNTSGIGVHTIISQSRLFKLRIVNVR